VCGLLLASPVIFLQLWRFIAPGLYKHEKRVLLPFTFVSTVCFIGGAAFGYFVVFPPAFSFFVGYSSEILAPMPGVSEYFSLALRLLIAFGLIFELPVFMVFLAKMGVVNRAFLKKHRKYSILFAFVIAAILTPTPDVVNQLLMAGPLIVLYEISIIAVSIFAKKTFRGFDVERGTVADTDTDTEMNKNTDENKNTDADTDERIGMDMGTNATTNNCQKKGD
jgi:sec-independent protein translocase protein TatC